jgi:hypothetical protein
MISGVTAVTFFDIGDFSVAIVVVIVTHVSLVWCRELRVSSVDMPNNNGIWEISIKTYRMVEGRIISTACSQQFLNVEYANYILSMYV